MKTIKMFAIFNNKSEKNIDKMQKFGKKQIIISAMILLILISMIMIVSSLPFRFYPTHQIVKQINCISCHPDETLEISKYGTHIKMMDTSQTRTVLDYLNIYGNSSQPVQTLDSACYQCHLTFSNYNLFGLTDPYFYSVGNAAVTIGNMIVNQNITDAQYGYIINWPWPFGNRTVAYNNSSANVTASLTVNDIVPSNSAVEVTMKIIMTNYSGQQNGSTVCDCYQTLSQGETDVVNVNNIYNDYFTVLLFLQGSWNSSTLNLTVSGTDKGAQSFTIYAANPPVLYNVPKDLTGVSYFKSGGMFKAARLDAVWEVWKNHSVNGHITASEDIQVSMGGQMITKNTCGAPHGMCHINQKATYMGVLDGSNPERSFYQHGMRSTTSINCKVCHLSGRLGSTGTDCIGCHQTQQGAFPAIDLTSFSLHRNVDVFDGIDKLTNGDCVTCHYDTSNMMSGNVATSSCSDCHTKGIASAPIVSNHIPLALSVSTNGVDCSVCHNNMVFKEIYSPNASIGHYTNYITDRSVIPYQHFGPINTSDCIECHNGPYTNNSSWGTPVNIATSTKRIHTETNTSQCDMCHNNGGVQSLALVDFHNASVITAGSTGNGTLDCIGCHKSAQGAYPAINMTSFSLHKNVNTLDGLDNLTNNDCVGCHYDTTNMFSGIVATRACQDCHTTGMNGAPIVSNHIPGAISVDSGVSCSVCHNNMVNTNNTSIYSDNASIGHYSSYITDRSVMPYQHFGPINSSDCIICHNGPYTNNSSWGSPVNISTSLKRQHNETDTSQCDLCHNNGGVQSLALVDFHNASVKNASGNGSGIGLDCINCHQTPQGSYAAINMASFSLHKNVNTADGVDNLTNNDCIGCHYDTLNMFSGIVATRACPDCHTTGMNNAPIVSNHIPGGLSVSTTGVYCSVCHNNMVNTLNLSIYSDNASIGHYSEKVTDISLMPYQHFGPINTSDCIECHNGPYTDNVSWGSPVNITTSLKRQHNETDTLQCDQCHNNGGVQSLALVDFHNSSVKNASGGPGGAGLDCLGCHQTAQGAYPALDIASFSLHKNVNISDGLGNLTNSDCVGCHYDTSNMFSGIVATRACQDCHTTGMNSAPIVSNHIPEGISVSTSPVYCSVCHINMVVKNIYSDNASIGHYSAYITDQTTLPYQHFGPINTSDCIICHNGIYTNDPNWGSPVNISTSTKRQHTETDTSQCDMCHNNGGVQSLALVDFHNSSVVNASGTGSSLNCVGCHATVASSYFGLHTNIDSTDGSTTITNNDCRGCHFNITIDNMKNGYANFSNTYFCEDCHVIGGRNPSQYANITNSTLIKSAMPSTNPPGHGQNNCEQCHIAGDKQPRPLPAEYQYHGHGPTGTASSKNCYSCHYRSDGQRDGGANIGLNDKPFNAPGEAHYCLLCHGTQSIIDSSGRPTDCALCHTSDNYHSVTIGSHNGIESTTIGSLTITTPVSSGGIATVSATVSSTFTQIARAQYKVIDASSNTVIDWTDMNAADGSFDERSEQVIGNISTTGLVSGTYSVLVKGMSSAATGAPAGGLNHDITRFYYPDNGVWTDTQSITLNIV